MAGEFKICLLVVGSGKICKIGWQHPVQLSKGKFEIEDSWNSSWL